MRFLAMFGMTHAVVAGLAVADGPAAGDAFEADVPIQAITRGPRSHWFGYYDKFQFDPSGRYVLGMAVDFDDRPPTPEDSIELGMVDLEDGDRWIPFAATTAWCWQQGCMLQWLPGSDSEVIYNVREGDHYAAVIRDVFSGASRTLPRPVYTVSPDGKQALGVNFARVGATRPGYGYYGIEDPWDAAFRPDKDGLYAMDLEGGASRRLFSLAEIAAVGDVPAETGRHWFNHLLFNPDGSRFVFLHRWHLTAATGRWHTRMLTAAADGTGLHVVADHEMVSHFIWRNPREILAWSREPDTRDHFYLYTDQASVRGRPDKSDQAEIIGDGILTHDGHCNYSPDRQWILTDSYPRNRMQSLMLFRPSDATLAPLGTFYLPPKQKGETRCDLHGRWDRDGRFVCIDSMHLDGRRQMYLLDVREAVGQTGGGE